MTHRIIIIGAGPAGLFCALSLIEGGMKDIVLIEQGKDLPERIKCKTEGGKKKRGETGVILTGFGGAGAFSDGKLTISSEVGGHLGELID